MRFDAIQKGRATSRQNQKKIQLDSLNVLEQQGRNKSQLTLPSCQPFQKLIEAAFRGRRFARNELIAPGILPASTRAARMPTLQAHELAATGGCC